MVFLFVFVHFLFQHFTQFILKNSHQNRRMSSNTSIRVLIKLLSQLLIFSYHIFEVNPHPVTMLFIPMELCYIPATLWSICSDPMTIQYLYGGQCPICLTSTQKWNTLYMHISYDCKNITIQYRVYTTHQLKIARGSFFKEIKGYVS